MTKIISYTLLLKGTLPARPGRQAALELLWHLLGLAGPITVQPKATGSLLIDGYF